ncbi:MAG: OsmC family protein [Dactylosporangium sp.]|nr:OsmC family protein [Dactylosporangium sp.]
MTVVAQGAGDGPFPTEIEVRGFRLCADEPQQAGGTGRGPNPYDLLLAALGACIAMTVRSHAGQKGWPLESVTVTLDHDRIHATDCAECMTKEGWLDRVKRRVTLVGALDDAQRAELLQVADRCPVRRTLTSQTVIADL